MYGSILGEVWYATNPLDIGDPGEEGEVFIFTPGEAGEQSGDDI